MINESLNHGHSSWGKLQKIYYRIELAPLTLVWPLQVTLINKVSNWIFTFWLIWLIFFADSQEKARKNALLESSWLAERLPYQSSTSSLFESTFNTPKTWYERLALQDKKISVIVPPFLKAANSWWWKIMNYKWSRRNILTVFFFFFFLKEWKGLNCPIFALNGRCRFF